jgi:hypothetical protein
MFKRSLLTVVFAGLVANASHACDLPQYRPEMKETDSKIVRSLKKLQNAIIADGFWNFLGCAFPGIVALGTLATMTLVSFGDACPLVTISEMRTMTKVFSITSLVSLYNYTQLCSAKNKVKILADIADELETQHA